MGHCAKILPEEPERNTKNIGMIGVLAESRNLNLPSTSQAVAIVRLHGDFTAKTNGLGECPYVQFLVIIDACIAFFTPGLARARM